MAAVPVICVSATDDVEERIRFLEAGADDVMARPFDAPRARGPGRGFAAALPAFAGPHADHQRGGITLTRAKRTVAVFSPKGGVGTTTIAVNIAVAAATRRPDRVVLVDFALQFGNVATHLNLDPGQTIADVVRDDSALNEPELLRTYAMRHDSGLHVLAAPSAPELSNS